MEATVKKRKRFPLKNPKMFLSASIGVLLINIYPLIMLVIRSLKDAENGGLTLSHYQEAFTAFGNVVTIKNSLILAVFSIAIALVLAVFSALSTARVNVPFRRFVNIGSSVTYVSPPWVAAMAYVYLLAPNSGVLNQWTMANLGFRLANIMTMGGMIFVVALFYYPYIYMTVTAALENMDSSYEEAALTVGCSPVKTLLKVTLPLVTPAIMTSVIFSFVMVWGLFSVPAMLGSPAKVYVFATYLYTLMNQLIPQFELSSALAVIFAVLAAILVSGGLSLAKKGQSGKFQVVGSKGHNSVRMDVGGWKYVMAFINVTIIFLTLILPYFCILLMSLSKSIYKPVGLANLTLEHYQSQLGHFMFLPILKNTLVLAFCVSVLCCILGIIIAYLDLRTPSKWSKMLSTASTLPIAIPSVAFTIGVSAAWMGKPFSLYGTLLLLVIAQAARFIAMSVQHFEDGFNQLHSSLEEGAKTCGASNMTVLMRISLPIMRPVLINTFLVVFMSSMRELFIPLFLGTGTTKTMTLAARIYFLWNEGLIPQAAALCVILVALMGIVYIICNLLMKDRREQKALRIEKRMKKEAALKAQKAA